MANHNLEIAAARSGEADPSLLRRFVETGDPVAFGTIVQRYGRMVFAASMRVLGDQGRAQDVSQETFFRLMRQPRAVTQSLAGWLHRSATHLALDVRRSEIARRRRELKYSLQSHSSGEDTAWVELSPLLDEALDELPLATRMLLVRHFLQGTPQEDLAVELNVSPATVSRRMKSALAELLTRLQQRGVGVSASSLLPLLLRCNAHPASAGFAAEMCKMRLFASARNASVDPHIAAQRNMQVNHAVETAAPIHVIIYGSIAALILAYLIGLTISCMTAGAPASSSQLHSTELHSTEAR